MSNTLRTMLRFKLVAAVAAPLLLGTVSAAAVSASAAEADLLYYTEKFYSNSSKTVQVGAGSGYCDGDYIMKSGYQTAYSTITYRTQCP